MLTFRGGTPRVARKAWLYAHATVNLLDASFAAGFSAPNPRDIRTLGTSHP